MKKKINLKRIAIFSVATMTLIFGLATPSKSAYASSSSDNTYGYQIGKPAYGQNPMSVASGSNGVTYVFDGAKRQIVKFADDGSVITRFNDTKVFGEYVNDIAVAPDGNIYTVSNGSIFSFTPTGDPIKTISIGSAPRAIAVDASGLIYVVHNNMVTVYDANGTEIRNWGDAQSSSDDGKFNYPNGIAIYNNEIYIVDQENNRIQVFSQSGEFVRKWSVQYPQSIDISTDGNIYVCKSSYSSGVKIIDIFNSNGNLLSSFGEAKVGTSDINNGEIVYRVSSISVSSYGKVYVIDLSAQNRGVQVFGPKHQYMAFRITKDDPKEGLYSPRYIARDSMGYIYVLDDSSSAAGASESDRLIKKFDSAGNYIDSITVKISNSDPDNTYNISIQYGFQVDDRGNIYRFKTSLRPPVTLNNRWKTSTQNVHIFQRLS